MLVGARWLCHKLWVRVPVESVKSLSRSFFVVGGMEARFVGWLLAFGDWSLVCENGLLKGKRRVK